MAHIWSTAPIARDAANRLGLGSIALGLPSPRGNLSNRVRYILLGGFLVIASGGPFGGCCSHTCGSGRGIIHHQRRL